MSEDIEIIVSPFESDDDATPCCGAKGDLHGQRHGRLGAVLHSLLRGGDGVTALRYHPLVLETAAGLWTDEADNVHPLCSCCYGCSGLTDDSELWTCADGLGCCDRRVVEQRVCSCPCHAAYVVSVRLERDGQTTYVVMDAKDQDDGVLSPGCDFVSALDLLHVLMDAGWRLSHDWPCGPIEWDNFRDVSTDQDDKPCCRCHLGYERVDQIINNEWESRT